MGANHDHEVLDKIDGDPEGGFSFATICKTHKLGDGLTGSQPFSDNGTSDNYPHFNTSESLYRPSHWRNSGPSSSATINKLADWLVKNWFVSKRRGEDWHHLDSDVWTRWISEPVRWRKFGREVTQPSSYDLTVDLTDLRPQRVCPAIPWDENDPPGTCYRAPDRRPLAREALKTWSAVTGIKFKERNRDADITFGDTGDEFADWGGPVFQAIDGVASGDMFFGSALSYVDEDNGYDGNYWNWINRAYILIHYGRDRNQNNRNQRIFQTYLHEIGHALGLGHPGPYNSNRNICEQAHFKNDSLSLSLMSYWDQVDSMVARPNETNKLVVTPNVADLRAFDRMYHDKAVGTINAFAGETVYGYKTNIDVKTSHHYARMIDNADRFQYTIVDRGRNPNQHDRIDFSYFDTDNDGADNSHEFNQIIDLRDSKPRRSNAFFSSVGGGVNNLNISYQSIIENAVAGRGDDKIVGNNTRNELYGHDGKDTLIGGKDTDYLFGDGRGHNSRRNEGGRPDKEWGRPYTDSMDGGKGDDHFYVNHTRDIVKERRNQGVDVIHCRAETFRMPAHTEEIWADVLAGTEPSFDFKGNESNNTIYGWSKDDTLSGLKGDDYLLSDDGDDSLTGGKGKDTLAGGLGNDTYYIDSLDQILESEDGGIDTVNAINQSITLAENLENANVVQDKVRLLEVNGNSSSNHITGVSSRLPRAQGLYLNGLGGNDTLEGSLLNDTLDGSTGVDSLIGGSGNDVYYLDSRHDKVIELSDNGRDKIYTRSLYSLLVTPHVEDIELQGTLNIGLIGNDLDNEITGNLGHNALLGGIGNDSLIGGFGNDSLDGGTGADTLFGGSGRDEYTIRGINDIIQESEMNTDIDHVKSYISFSLVANRYGQVRDIENLSLVGNQATYAYGNPLDNRITGNDLDNTLIGFGGMDIIKGGLGADRIAGGDDFDTFLYTSISESPFGENDVITDFDQSQFDVIDLTDIDANVNIAGDQAFELSFSSDFIPEAGTAVFNSSTKMLNLYVDSTVLPSMSIEIPSVDILRSSDLYL